MANKTIGQLTQLTPNSSTELAIFSNNTTGKATVSDLLDTENLVYADDAQTPTSTDVDFESEDTSLTPSSTTSVDLLQGSDSWSQRFVKISQMFKNIRWIFKKIGSTDITSLDSNGTLTGAIDTLNNNLFKNTVQLSTYSTSSSISVPNNTNTNLITITLTPGYYIIKGTSLFTTNGTGNREIHLSKTSAGIVVDRYCRGNAVAVSGAGTVVNFTYVEKVTTTTTYYLVALQNSGSTLTVDGGLRVIKLT